MSGHTDQRDKNLTDESARGATNSLAASLSELQGIDPNSPADVRALMTALMNVFQSTEESYQRLTETHERLQDEIRRLNAELESKNRELEDKNHELQASLQEQQRLHHSLRSIVNSLHDGVIAADLDGNVTLFNRRAAELTSKSEDDVVGRHYGDALESHPPLLKTLESARPEVQEFEDYLGDRNAKPRQIEVTTAPVHDDQNVLLGAVEVLRDLTERREMEAQLRRANMLAALGKVSVTIAHEIRNPLGAIQLRAELLRDADLGEHDRAKAFDTIFSAIKIMDNTISNLLQFTRPVTTTQQFQNLSPLLDQSLSLTEHATRVEGVEVQRDYPPVGLMCHVDDSLFIKAMLNLILNAVHATEKKESRVVIVRARRHEDGSAELFDGTPWLEIEVEDNGCGISQDMLEQVFTPFVTTKDHGVGLGLPIVHNILEAHEGKVTVESTPDVGTCFRLLLPVYRPGDGASPARLASKPKRTL